MSAERPRRGGFDEGARIGRAADTIVGDQGEMFTASRGAYGSVSIGLPAPDPVPGPARRDVGHRRVAQTTGAEPWLRLAASWIETAAARGVIFDAEVLRDAVGEPPEANLLGVAIKRAQLHGVIVAAGVEVAQRPEAHGRLIRRWAAPGTPRGV